MSRKYVLMGKALMAGLLLTACKNNTTDNNIVTSKPNVEPMAIPSVVTPVITIMPEEPYKAEDDDGLNLVLSASSLDDGADLIYQDWTQLFQVEEITDDIKKRINGKSYGEDCIVPYEDLRYVKVLHWGFDEDTHEGELIVNKAIAEDIVEIFKELYENNYPIEKMILVDEYDADDDASMADNNTSAFNYRPVPDGSGRLSKHSYGLAIDINPLYNPYIRYDNGKRVVLPESGTEYADRTIYNPYYIVKDDICYKAFTSRGFIWGGDWKNTKDYQHFQKIID